MVHDGDLYELDTESLKDLLKLAMRTPEYVNVKAEQTGQLADVRRCGGRAFGDRRGGVLMLEVTVCNNERGCVLVRIPNAKSALTAALAKSAVRIAATGTPATVTAGRISYYVRWSATHNRLEAVKVQFIESE